jgi:N-acetylneuraminic acid mutarotase
LAHQVFLSYATEDRDTASRVCALLEGDGIQCWMAPRDVKAGTDYAAAILGAIRNAQLAVLVFSSHSNTSPYALREIERAVAYGRPVLAVRIDKTAPTPSLEYYLHEWIDAAAGIETRRKEILAAVHRQLAKPAGAATTRARGAVVAPAVPLQPGVGQVAAFARRWGRKTWAMAGVGVVVVAALGLGLGLGLTRGHTASNAAGLGNRVAWTEIKPGGTSPPARGTQAMAYDPTGGRLILFGGGTASAVFNDTWAYAPATNTWTELSPKGELPPPRAAHEMAYDKVTHRLIVFGGRGAGTSLNDTWAYDPTTNTWTDLKPAEPLPSPRSAYSMAYDPVTRRLIMFGGRDNAGTSLNDTWAYDPAKNTWTELEPGGTQPLARSTQGMVADPTTHRLLMFGGRGAGSALGDTWAYDPNANAWMELKPAVSPTPRVGPAMVWDETGLRVIVFGGRDSSGTSLDDTWAYDPAGRTWARLTPSFAQPAARVGHTAVYDSTSGGLIMFGGENWRDDFLNDLWSLTSS